MPQRSSHAQGPGEGDRVLPKQADGLYGETARERGTFFKLKVYKRVGILKIEVYERVGNLVIVKKTLINTF